ncbi:hypothetical protein QOZ80_5AG0385450 [Eleusine coracana subsp. coracana]|nr:hypothetical protein QOZ80_5AG0385450 [Eleusine coracana subsp. coracana]
MMSRSLFFLLAAHATYACAAATSPITTLEDSTCPWRTVADVNSSYVQGYGSFALEHTTLSFVKVESATAQAVEDCGNQIKRNYALIIDAIQRPGGEVHKYKALVYVQSSIPIKLISIQAVVRPRPPSAN